MLSASCAPIHPTPQCHYDAHLHKTKQHIIIDCEMQVRNESKPEVAGQILTFPLLLLLELIS